MCDQKQPDASDDANRLPSIFTPFDPIQIRNMQRIRERKDRRFKRDAVFAEIFLRLLRIPFETNIIHQL